MARSVLALAILGLGVVRALPTSRAVEERQILGGGWGGTVDPNDPSRTPSPCLGDVPPSGEQSPCFVTPPITGTLNPPKEKRQGGFGIIGLPPGSEKERAIAALELQLLALKSKPDPTDEDLAQIEALEQMLTYAEGITSISAPPGVNTTLTHGNRKRFSFPPDWNGDRKKAIDELEKELEALQNQEIKSEDDYVEIEEIKEALQRLAGIEDISAPPGTSTTFHPGKEKRFTLPPDWNNDVKKAIDQLERRLEELQNVRNKSQDDLSEIKDLKEALHYLAGIVSIVAPPGSSSTFHPGKARRFTLPPDAFTNTKRVIDEIEKELVALQNKAVKTAEDRAEIEDLKAALRYLTGITSIIAPPGSSTTFHPGKRQTGSGPVIGAGACELLQVLGLQQALAALWRTHGGPSTAPPDVAELERSLIAALRYCGKYMDGDGTVPGGSINPDPTYPGGTITPDPSHPGGGINPDPYQPGGSLQPSD
ncbi:hypothetical protein GQ53DRAFT_457007 [Thozetella sp. PMI_491]|nr:hypothetical protein GQ53DRAFT_457007 [Thozetella sp. PMI_491]